MPIKGNVCEDKLLKFIINCTKKVYSETLKNEKFCREWFRSINHEIGNKGVIFHDPEQQLEGRVKKGVKSR